MQLNFRSWRSARDHQCALATEYACLSLPAVPRHFGLLKHLLCHCRLRSKTYSFARCFVPQNRLLSQQTL